MGNIVVILILLVLSGFFSASETAYSSVNRIRLKNYESQGNKKASKTLRITDNFDKTLTTILVGNNIVNIASASLATVVFTEFFGPKSVGFATIIMTIAVLVFGEVLPKSFAKQNAEKIALALSGILGFLIKIFTPITAVFILLKNKMNKRFETGENQPSVTEEELKYIIEEIQDEGVLEEQESDLVRNALEFDEIIVDEILIPRVNVAAIDINDSLDNIKEEFMNIRHSRLPVYDKSIDNIIGVIHQRDFFKMLLKGEKHLKHIVRDVIYISDLKTISEAMREIQRNKTHMAIVMDQYGGTKGIITLEDILEELVGEIYDESDLIVNQIEEINDNEYIVSAEMNVYDIFEELELSENDIQSESNSMGGWFMELFGRIPEKDDEVADRMFSMKVLELKDMKIEKILFKVNREVNNDDE